MITGGDDAGENVDVHLEGDDDDVDDGDNDSDDERNEQQTGVNSMVYGDTCKICEVISSTNKEQNDNSFQGKTC